MANSPLFVAAEAMIGIFGGTFDPIHFGHLHMAKQILERKGLSSIWFCPAYQSPHKKQIPTDARHRQKMVELAIADTPAFKLLDWEIKRGGISYTVETIRELKKQYPDKQFALLIADELVAGLPSWEGIHEILEGVPLMVSQRQGAVATTGDPKIDNAIDYVETPPLEVEATVIRDRLKKKLNCSNLLPASVIRYIKQNHLYE